MLLNLAAIPRTDLPRFNPLILLNGAFDTDSYKLSHKFMEPQGTQSIYNNGTARTAKYFKRRFPDFDNKVVVFGIQMYVLNGIMTRWQKGFFERPLEDVMAELEAILLPYIGFDRSKLTHFEELHKLGYLPLCIKSLPEGTAVPIGVPLFTIENTHPAFSWIPNYIESAISAETWKPMEIATAAREFRRLTDKWWDKTVVDHSLKKFADHDFSLRGHANIFSAATCGAGTLTCFNGTDNVPSVVLSRAAMGAHENVAASVPASEHSVTTLGINFFADDQELGEYLTLERLLTQVFPEGLLSYVSDSYDYWRVLTLILPRLKHIIFSRPGKLVIRPDSGNPVEMVCGTSINVENFDSIFDVLHYLLSPSHTKTIKFDGKFYKATDKLDFDFIDHGRVKVTEALSTCGNCDDLVDFGYLEQVEIDTNAPEFKGSIEVLWDLFGGTVNDKGYKELHPNIGLIYGDGITYERAEAIFRHLEAKGFAASNVVFGIGSFSYAGGTRDDVGFAIKATNATVNGEDIPLFKDPKTDDGTKKSARGLLCVDYNEEGEITLYQNVSRERASTGLLQTVFKDGKFVKFDSFPEIQARVEAGLATL